MSHYAALISLKHTIKRIKYLTQVSNLSSFPQIDSLYEQVLSLQIFFDTRDSSHGRNWNSFGEEFREAICHMEDVLESQMSAQLLSHCKMSQIGFCKVEHGILFFCERVEKIKLSCSLQSSNLALQQITSSVYSSRNWFSLEGRSQTQLVGMQDELGKLKHLLLSNESERCVIKIIGMAGIGKTALAKAVIEDPQVWNHFDCHIFVPVGPNSQSKDVLLCILSQLNHEIDDDKKKKKKMNHDEETLTECVLKILTDKRYIILFDDVWDGDSRVDLTRFLPNKLQRGRVMLTTRLHYSSDGVVFRRLHKRFLDKEESWDLLRQKVFDKGSCPYELKKLGKQIAEKCEGLPLAIISVGNHLAKAEKTVEYWESLAEKGIASIITADDEVFKVLHPSYQYLLLRLKAFFLYLGVFPQCCEISTSKIANLWIAEEFLDVDTFTDSEYVAHQCLLRIQEDSLLIVKQQRSLNYGVRVKTCSLHIVYWCYCKIQARREKLFQILNTIEDSLAEDTKGQRRLCIHNNSLFGMKDSLNSMASVLSMRSMLCTGPYHKYPVSISLGLKLLKVLDAVSIRFYEFPFEMLNLVLVRYLAFTYDGRLDASISQLISLQFLIVRRHVRVINSRCPSFLPTEIWNMKELKHLQVEGSDLPEPPHHGAELPNLLKLLDEVVRRTFLKRSRI